jgi:hypothetical protein
VDVFYLQTEVCVWSEAPEEHDVEATAVAAVANGVAPGRQCVTRGERRHSVGYNRNATREVAVTPEGGGGGGWRSHGLAVTALGEFAKPEALI